VKDVVFVQSARLVSFYEGKSVQIFQSVKLQWIDGVSSLYILNMGFQLPEDYLRKVNLAKPNESTTTALSGWKSTSAYNYYDVQVNRKKINEGASAAW
jgi:hypothetical protein